MKPLIVGAGGFLGRNITDELDYRNIEYSILRGKRDCNFLDYNQTLSKLHSLEFDTLVNVSSVVGGITFNGDFPATLMYQNVVMAMNLIQAAITVGCKRIIQIGTVCSYPRIPEKTPFSEDCLYRGEPDHSNKPYGFSKLCVMQYLEACEREYGTKYLILIPTNMFGKYDNYREESSHVIPAIIRKVVKAKQNKESSITCLGTGQATRDMLWARDCAEAIVLALKSDTKEPIINLGTGIEYKICFIAESICEYMGYDGKIEWDTTKPDGQPRRILDITRAKKELNWIPNITLKAGLQEIIRNKWYEGSNI